MISGFVPGEEVSRGMGDVKRSLADVLRESGGPVELLYNSQTGPRVFPVVPPEYTNWRDEQRAWRESCVLFDQSHHMTDFYVEGRDAFGLLESLGINSFRNFASDKAKQYVACNPDGYVIGDVILYRLGEERFLLVGRPSVHNWVRYHAEKRGAEVEMEIDERTDLNPAGRRRLYRYQIQGPNALGLVEKLNGGPVPRIPFFNVGEINVAGRKVKALRHGMAGQPGFEIFGPWEEGEEIRGAIVEAGEEFGLRQAGSLAYQSATTESGWIPCPVPAIYTGEELEDYREWLPANTYEATASLGGSYYSEDIEDYYFTPYDLGYGHMVGFDHDFVGREALERISGRPPRKKVTLVWDGDDVTEKIFSSLFERDGLPAKHLELPSSWYSALQYDRVVKGGRTVGISTYVGYSHNERSMLSLASVDVDLAEPGTQLTLLWGEKPNSRKPQVEPHEQVEIKATVAPAPLVEYARTSYREAS